MQLWLIVFGIACAIVIAAAAYYYIADKEPPFVRELLALLGSGGLGGTARNIYSDGPARRAEAEVKIAEADVIRAQAGIGSYVPPQTGGES